MWALHWPSKPRKSLPLPCQIMTDQTNLPQLWSSFFFAHAPFSVWSVWANGVCEGRRGMWQLLRCEGQHRRGAARADQPNQPDQPAGKKNTANLCKPPPLPSQRKNPTLHVHIVCPFARVQHRGCAKCQARSPAKGFVQVANSCQPEPSNGHGKAEALTRKHCNSMDLTNQIVQELERLCQKGL